MIPPTHHLDLLQRFIDKIEVVGECWLWTAARNSKGYPVIRVGRKVMLAHRVSHDLFVSPTKEGLDVHHTCQRQRCVRPCHLEQTDPPNNRAMQAAGVGSWDEVPF